MADFNDTQQSTVKKVIEYLAPRSGSYQSFKDILRKLDFSVEDGSLDNNSKDGDGDPSVFSFTANRVLLDKERTTDTTYYLRIPKSQTYVQIPAAAVRWHRNKQTMKVTLPMEADFPAYRYGKESRVSVADLSEHFDKQMAQKKRSGLRIKPPGAQRYLKTKYMETTNGQPLDLDSVKLMTSQGRLSPQMKKLLTTDSLKAIHEMRTEIYRQAGINTIPMNQPWKKTRCLAELRRAAGRKHLATTGMGETHANSNEIPSLPSRQSVPDCGGDSKTEPNHRGYSNLYRRNGDPND